MPASYFASALPFSFFLTRLLHYTHTPFAAPAQNLTRLDDLFLLVSFIWALCWFSLFFRWLLRRRHVAASAASQQGRGRKAEREGCPTEGDWAEVGVGGVLMIWRYLWEGVGGLDIGRVACESRRRQETVYPGKTFGWLAKTLVHFLRLTPWFLLLDSNECSHWLVQVLLTASF